MSRLDRFALILCALALLYFGAHVVAASMRPPHAKAHHIEEDDPRWSCETMGNRVCGRLR